mmetsp:Transcript_7302/g.16567  ORF Transcript_7302/g.16567 Transcript_7302/m.16567 type:complete len:600 (+) Transcript_7302:83-1882(+)
MQVFAMKSLLVVVALFATGYALQRHEAEVDLSAGDGPGLLSVKDSTKPQKAYAGRKNNKKPKDPVEEALTKAVADVEVAFADPDDEDAPPTVYDTPEAEFLSKLSDRDRGRYFSWPIYSSKSLNYTKAKIPDWKVGLILGAAPALSGIAMSAFRYTQYWIKPSQEERRKVLLGVASCERELRDCIGVGLKFKGMFDYEGYFKQIYEPEYCLSEGKQEQWATTRDQKKGLEDYMRRAVQAGGTSVEAAFTERPLRCWITSQAAPRFLKLLHEAVGKLRGECKDKLYYDTAKECRNSWRKAAEMEADPVDKPFKEKLEELRKDPRDGLVGSPLPHPWVDFNSPLKFTFPMRLWAFWTGVSFILSTFGLVPDLLGGMAKKQEWCEAAGANMTKWATNGMFDLNDFIDGTWWIQYQTPFSDAPSETWNCRKLEWKLNSPGKISVGGWYAEKKVSYLPAVSGETDRETYADEAISAARRRCIRKDPEFPDTDGRLFKYGGCGNNKQNQKLWVPFYDKTNGIMVMTTGQPAVPLPKADDNGKDSCAFQGDNFNENRAAERGYWVATRNKVLSPSERVLIKTLLIYKLKLSVTDLIETNQEGTNCN